MDFHTLLQLMSLLRNYDVVWPLSTIQLLSYSDSVNLGISIVAPACFVKGYDFFIYYIATMAQPVCHTLTSDFIYLGSRLNEIASAKSFKPMNLGTSLDSALLYLAVYIIKQ